jgi:hypothetical protein
LNEIWRKKEENKEESGVQRFKRYQTLYLSRTKNVALPFENQINHTENITTFTPTNNGICGADYHSPWALTDTRMNRTPTCMDSNVKQFKLEMIQHMLSTICIVFILITQLWFFHK